MPITMVTVGRTIGRRMKVRGVFAPCNSPHMPSSLLARLLYVERRVGPVAEEHFDALQPNSLSDLGLRCTHDADNTVWCNTKVHDAAATNTISPIVT
jgi:hypothetical protein